MSPNQSSTVWMFDHTPILRFALDGANLINNIIITSKAGEKKEEKRREGAGIKRASGKRMCV